MEYQFCHKKFTNFVIKYDWYAFLFKARHNNCFGILNSFYFYFIFLKKITICC